MHRKQAVGLECGGERKVGELEPAGEHVLCRGHAPVCEAHRARAGAPSPCLHLPFAGPSSASMVKCEKLIGRPACSHLAAHLAL